MGKIGPYLPVATVGFVGSQLQDRPCYSLLRQVQLAQKRLVAGIMLDAAQEPVALHILQLGIFLTLASSSHSNAFPASSR